MHTRQHIRVNQRNEMFVVEGSISIKCDSCEDTIDLLGLKDVYSMAWGHLRGKCRAGHCAQMDQRVTPAAAYGFDNAYVAGYKPFFLPGHIVVYDRTKGATWLGNQFHRMQRFAICHFHTVTQPPKCWSSENRKEACSWGRYIASFSQETTYPSPPPQIDELDI